MGEIKEGELQFCTDFLVELLNNIEKDGSQVGKDVLYHCSAFHYRASHMEEVLKPFVGNLNTFMEFLSGEWGWKLKYDELNHILIADENKNVCVCPMAQGRNIPPVLCNCSEGFAERMFSYVLGRPVKATVISSILRGADTCVYRIDVGIENSRLR